MQIDLSQIPAEGRLGLMPASGVLYFFLDLVWGDLKFKVIHAEDTSTGWRSMDVPSNLKAAFGSEAKYVWPWARSDAQLPRLLPKWPFEPVLISVEPGEPEEDEGEIFAPTWGDATNALLEAQGGGVMPKQLDVRDFLAEDRRLIRPFAAFPPDWRTVQIIAADMSERATHAKRYDTLQRQFANITKDDRDAMMDRLIEMANQWLDHADSVEPFAAVPASESDAFWLWLEETAVISTFSLGSSTTKAIEASLTASPEAAARVPENIADRVRGRHMLAGYYDGEIFASTPDRMLAAHSDVQGNQFELAQTHLLLLEMSSAEGLGHHFGEGVYQFWITPDDLKHRRFDKVVLTADAY